MDKIERIDLETGENREVVLSSNNMDMFSVSVFEDFIYWSDRTHANGSIKRGYKDNATDSVPLRTGIGVQLKDIKVFNRDRQKGEAGLRAGAERGQGQPGLGGRGTR